MNYAEAYARAVHYAKVPREWEAKQPGEETRQETWDDGTVVVWRRSPFPLLQTQVQSPTGSEVKAAKTVTVPLDDLYGTQPEVTDAGLSKPRDDSHGLPLVVRSNGVRYIQDGHHRLSKAYFNGEREAAVRFVDLDSPSR